MMLEQLMIGFSFIVGIIFLCMFIDLFSSDDSSDWLYISGVREIVGKNLILQERLDDFLRGGAPREKRDDFLSSLRIAAEEMKISKIFSEAGIDKPSGTDRLMAAQILAIQEQNAILKKDRE